ncbi:hypothetical protein [Tautonia rosea]|uniref:hypothetical protein n=1 Tax=Tautonia rosea TaxID=2728037 RepID=UPI001C724369|nr:hypothetical protein [Tautonia rosea]
MHLGLMYAALVETGAITPDGRPLAAKNPEAADFPRNRNDQAMSAIVSAPIGEGTGVSSEPEGAVGCPTEAGMPAVAS